MKNVLAVIPARGGSKRVPRKNIKEIGGVPLVGHTIVQAKASRHIDRIIVSTDDVEIGNISINYGAEVIERPEEYRNDNTVMESDNIFCQVVEDSENENYKVDVAVLLFPTSPLRPVEKIDEAIELVLSGEYDCALSLVPDQGYFWRLDKESSNLKPYNYDPDYRIPSVLHDYQQFREDKSIYTCTRDLLIDNRSRIGGKIGYVTMSAQQSIDIDTQDDLDLCRYIYGFMNR